MKITNRFLIISTLSSFLFSTLILSTILSCTGGSRADRVNVSIQLPVLSKKVSAKSSSKDALKETSKITSKPTTLSSISNSMLKSSSKTFSKTTLNSKKILQSLFTNELIPAGIKACFSIDISGPSIPVGRGATTCTPELGMYVGFAEEGSTINLEIPKGNNRMFKLGVYLIDETTPCPALNEEFFTNGNPFENVFLGGEVVQNLLKDEETVVIPLDLNAESPSVASLFGLTSCALPPAGLHGVLYSNGDVLNASLQPYQSGQLNFSAPFNESFSKVDPGQNNILGLGLFLTSNLFIVPELLPMQGYQPLQMDSFVFSFTTKPDSLIVYALDHGGNVVEMSSEGSASEIAVEACPFTTCKVPVWLQSISAGYGNNLYGLDHAGNVYQIVSESNLISTDLVVEPQVTQVSYY